MKHYFNMVEVLLALGITAVGIVGLMAVIPVSLKATRDAQAEYFATDVANTHFDKWDTDMKKVVKENGADAFKNWANNLFPSDADVVPNQWNPVDADAMKVDGMNIGEAKSSDEAGAGDSGDKFSIDGYTSVTGVLPIMVGKKGEKVADFAGDIKFWQQKGLEIYDGEQDTDGDSIIRVFIEVSWPSIAPYDAREKRIFCRDFVNPKVEVTP